MKTCCLALLLCCLVDISLSLQNYLINPDFATPNTSLISTFTIYPGGIPGWSAQNLKMGLASSFTDNMWPQLPAIDIDSGTNQNVTQIMGLPNPGSYYLEFMWAANKGNIPSSLGDIYWNGLKVLSIVPTNPYLVHEKLEVFGQGGLNTLSIVALGTADNFGLVLARFRLTHKNQLINNCFSYPLQKRTSTIYQGGILGWAGFEVQVGTASVFNTNYGPKMQAVELVANTPQSYTATMNCMIPGRSYTIGYIWSASSGNSLTNQQFSISFNSAVIAEGTPTDFGLHYNTTTVLAIAGPNKLILTGVFAGAVTYGINIQSVSVV